MAPAATALAARRRVITFSLCGDPGTAPDLDPLQGIETFVRQIDRELDAAGVDRAAICGVSLGGLIALRYAAVRPGRVSALVLVSTPGPRWQPNRVQAFCARHRLLAPPVFLANATAHLLPEVVRARGWPGALPFVARHGLRVVTHPASTRRMRQRLNLWLPQVGRDCERVKAPTLVLTGERDLDRVVPVEGTLEYLSRIAGARAATLERTGHIGLITRPERFAEIVAGFVDDVEDSRTGRDARSAAR